MTKVPGYGPTLCALADFMTGPEDESEKAARLDPMEVLETVGLARSRHLALTFFAINYEFQNMAQFNWAPLWRHQVSTGVILDFLYDALSLKRVGTEYAAGAIHEIGRLILAELFPFACFTAMNRALKEKISLSICERETFGIDHAELGAAWLRENQLPQSLVDAIMFHDTPEKISRRSLLAHALVSTNQLVKQLGIGYSGNPWLDPHPWEEMPSTRIMWEARGNKEYLFEDFTQDILEQFQNFPELI
jgi:HD-like signal output (HDOD) protein